MHTETEASFASPPPPHRPIVGVLGLGTIGSRIADCLSYAGYPLAVWSHHPRQRPDFCANPRLVAEQAHVIQLFVRDDAALLAAIESMLPALTRAHIVCNHATVSPSATTRAAELVHGTGAGFLDAPFTGSKMAAQNGKLVYYVGGQAEILDYTKPILQASSSRIMHVGAVGTGTVLKIATNAITAVTLKGLAESLSLTTAAGVSAQSLLEALEPNANFSPLLNMKLSGIIRQDYSPHFSVQNMLKDADIALAMAPQSPALSAAAAALRHAVSAGQAEEDFSIIASQP
jgi:3-hydroxyisobutyrate dehydrogenase-like beta-hydroxyacid dehydrogenase